MSAVPNVPVQWPDLSSYGVTLGIVETAAGRGQSLVFSDEQGKYAHIARGMGFARTRWPGLWVRPDVRIQPGSFRSAFPNLKIVQSDAGQISAQILLKIDAHVHVLRQRELPGFDAIDDAEVQRAKNAKVALKYTHTESKKGSNKQGLKASALEDSSIAGEVTLQPGTPVTPDAPAIAGTEPEVDGFYVDLSALSIDNVPLGFNKFGEEVYQAPDSRRFSKLETPDGVRIRREDHLSFPDPKEAGLFLRGNTPEALDVSADGLVWAMAHGRTIRVEDFAQFFRSTTGREMPKNVKSDPDFDGVVNAVDRARVRSLASLALSPDADAFAAALRLHEAAQYYSIISDSRMTPLPIGVVLQHMALSMPRGSTVRVANAERGEFSILSGEYFKPALDGERQDLLMGAYEGRPLDVAVEAFGAMVTRDDHAQTLRMLEQMSEAGLGIFVVDGDTVPGRIGPTSRRFLDTVASHYQVEGIVDVDGMLMGVPGGAPKRIVVVGAKHAAPISPILPDSLPFVTDYESLWSWGDRTAEAIRKPGSVPMGERGAISNVSGIDQANSYQSPYIPTSTLSDPTLMVPRNLASPLRRAMIEIQRTTPHTDQWLADQLQMTMEQLRGAFSPEQADSLVMAIKRGQQGLGFMCADQTGTGKGRILAGIALYQRLNGEQVVFLTEKSGLFTDFWRDIENIGAAQHFQNIFVINDDVKVFSPKTEQLVAQSADRDVLQTVLRSMQLPKDADLVMATYSQFNRDPVKATVARGVADLDAVRKSFVSPEVLKLIARAKAMRSALGKKDIQSVSVDAVDIITRPEILSVLPMEALKPLWIGRAMKGAHLLLDESHNMSGEESQTAMNLIHATMNAKTVSYSSATFARAEKNMRSYRRLFPASVDVEALHETLKRGGEPLQEALSSMLAEDGALVRREHDLSMLKFNPQVDFKNTARNEDYADKLAEILAAMALLTREAREYSDALSDDLKSALVAARNLQGPNGVALSATAKATATKGIGVLKRSSIGNDLYTTMRSFLTVIKNDLVIERAVANLQEGRKPGIIIEHTMEADLNRAVDSAIEKGESVQTLDGLIIPRPSFRTLMRNMLQNMSQVSLDGKDLELQKNPQFTTVIRLIEEKIASFPDIPLCPLDYVRQGIEKAGYKCVELSGRKRDLVDLGDGKVLVRKIPKGARDKAKDAFNNGAADAILLTRAGNSGISLHASPTFLDTRQRVVLEAEVPEDVVVRVQFFGRFNRKDQTSHPIIETLSSNLPAENRNLAIQNNKLRKMSANVTANRDNAEVTKNIADIINSVGNEVAFKFLELRPELALKLDVTMPDQEERMSEGFEIRGEKYITQLFSKMVMLLVVQQREVISEVTQEFDATIEELDARGVNPLKAKFFDVNARKTGSETLEFASFKNDDEVEKQYKSTFDRPVLITGIEYAERFSPVAKEELLGWISDGKEKFVETLIATRGENFAKPASKNNDYISNFVVDSVLDMRESMMNMVKAGRFESVAAALADPENNMVKTMQWKTDKIMDVMGSMRIGSSIQVTHPQSGVSSMGIVIGMSIPVNDRDLCAPGRYFFEIATPGRRDTVRMSLSQMIEDNVFKLLEAKVSLKSLALFDETRAIAYTVNRNVLDGNLFRAAEVSIQADVGTQALYSDEHGMANRAVVLPLGVNKKSFNALPLRIIDKDLATQFLSEMQTSTLTSVPSPKSDGLDGDYKGLTVKRTGGEIFVSLPGSKGRQEWLKNNTEVMAVTGPFAGSRRKIFAAVPLDQIEALVDVLYKAGITLYAHPYEIAHKKEYEYSSMRNMGSKEKTLTMGTTTAREWFVEAMGLQDAELGINAGLKHKDPMAEFDCGLKLKRA